MGPCQFDSIVGSGIASEDRGYRPRFPGRFSRTHGFTDSRIHGLIHRIKAFSQVSQVGFVLVVQRLSLTCKVQVKKGCSAALQKNRGKTVEGNLSYAATTRNKKGNCVMKMCSLSLKIFLTYPLPCVCWFNGEKPVGRRLVQTGHK
ncbi:hypothetical protein CSKR_113705 [Clonorchis sinensis]|uniref:Uncharacterized protein n=1 Tax=Clonorchis sinensis TaxID=79923 RepID=A0A3R7CWR0_CLOSI|nr:hypothetical protein CSKR_113705 [Clonorchis sinensis]